MRTTADRYHDISCGHRVAGHESKCAYLHGHNYRVTFWCEAAKLDQVGRVIDFSVMKSRLCMWLEENWDHRFLAWEEDPEMIRIKDSVMQHGAGDIYALIKKSIVWVPFNPTAENMAEHLLRVVGPRQLRDTGVQLIKVRVEETRKCAAEAGE